MNRHRTELYRIARACPYGECRDGCPMKAVRKLPVEQRYAEIIRLTADQAEDIHRTHILCEAERSEQQS